MQKHRARSSAPNGHNLQISLAPIGSPADGFFTPPTSWGLKRTGFNVNKVLCKFSSGRKEVFAKFLVAKLCFV